MLIIPPLDTRFLLFIFSRERREAELCKAFRSAATPEEAAIVLQRYALRFTISDATLDSLKLPRASPSTPRSDLNEEDGEDKLTAPVNGSETSEPRCEPEPQCEPEPRCESEPQCEPEPRYEPEPRCEPESRCEPEQTITTEAKDTEPEKTQSRSAPEQQVAASVPTSPHKPHSFPTALPNSESVPAQSLDFNEPQSTPTESQTRHEDQPTSTETQPQIRPWAHTPPAVPSVPSRPLPLLVAKPYRQPSSKPSGHKPVKVSESHPSVI